MKFLSIVLLQTLWKIKSFHFFFNLSVSDHTLDRQSQVKFQESIVLFNQSFHFFQGLNLLNNFCETFYNYIDIFFRIAHTHIHVATHDTPFETTPHTDTPFETTPPHTDTTFPQGTFLILLNSFNQSFQCE